MTTQITGRARHRGAGNSAVMSGALNLTVLDIDDAGVSVPALVCSAAGYDYGVTAEVDDSGSVVFGASRPTRQRR